MNRTQHMNRSHVLTWIAAALAVVVFASGALSGCMVDVAQPTPTPTRTPLPAATPVPTLPPQPTMTPIGAAPTVTDLPPTETPLPENVNPLTGEVVADPSTLERVPVAIKISNWPGQYVRPQAGINSADLIYEHYNEGWFASRWTAIYLGQDPERVGPVRSGRIIDLEIPAIYKAVFACSGFSNGVIALFKASDLYPDWVVSESLPATLSPSPFYRDHSRDVPLEHTMYTDPDRIRAWAAEHDVSGRQDLQGMVFTDEPTVEGTPATTIEIPFNYLDAEWRYDEASGRYLRWSDGVAHTDALDGQQLSAANVVVLYVPQYNTDIVEDAHSGALSIRWELWYSNRAIIFRDGVQTEAFWQRWERPDMLTLTDEEGAPIPLKVGNTFFEVLPTDGERWIEIAVR
jgi:hypothetical protein